VEEQILLEDVVRHIEEKLHGRGVHLRIGHRGSLPNVLVDLGQFRNALEQVMAFCRVLPRADGNLQLDAGLNETDGQAYVELRVAISSGTPLDVGKNGGFQAFLRVDDHEVALSVELAREILHRQRGRVIFRKQNLQGKLATILLRVSSNPDGAGKPNDRKRIVGASE
jgi:hypothetical protein